MIGRSLTQNTGHLQEQFQTGFGNHLVEVLRARLANVLELKNVFALNTLGQALKDLSLTVLKGEILGIAGVDGNGQSELAEIVSGLRKIQSGQVFIDGRDITECRRSR